MNLKVKIDWFKWLLSIFSATDDITYTASEFVEHANNSRNRSLIIVLLFFFRTSLLVLVFISVAFFTNNNTVYNVSARSEIVSVSPFPGAQYPDWKLKDASFSYGDEEVKNASGTLSINSNSTVLFERVGVQNTYIAIEGKDKALVASLMSSDGRVYNFTEDVFITISSTDEKPVSFLFDGTISIGGGIEEGKHPMPILLSGKVDIADKAALSQEYYIASPYELKIGDMFSIDSPVTQSSGFLYIDDSPGMQITYSGKGKEAYIERYKSEPIKLKNSVWTKLINDQTLIFLWVFFVMLYTVIKVIIRLSLDKV